MNRVEEIKMQIAKLQGELLTIQGECCHPKLARKSENKSNTGNYDPSADCYWTEHHCTLCDKRWTEDQ